MVSGRFIQFRAGDSETPQPMTSFALVSLLANSSKGAFCFLGMGSCVENYTGFVNGNLGGNRDGLRHLFSVRH